MQRKANPFILVIDDEVTLLQSVAVYLEDSGFIVKCAEDGKKGLEIFRNNHPDLVLTDLHMPVLSGLEVLNTISKESPETPVIVISGAGELNDAIAALRLGAWDYVTKPISDLQVLEHAIKKALQTKKLQEENTQYAQRIAHNLKILEEDQAAGRKVQLTMLPMEHEIINNFEFIFRMLPSLQLCGDFVEYFRISADIIGVYVADVSGHGASSAFITILLKSIISKYQVHYTANKDDTILYPAKLMAALSAEIYNAKLNKYITLIYGVIDTSTSVFSYGVAGHYPNPILYNSKVGAKILTGEGFPIGIMASVQYEAQSISLQAGDHLFMFTDGIMEVLMPGNSLELKEQALLQAVQNSKGEIGALLSACGVSANSTVAQPDDITVLVMSHI